MTQEPPVLVRPAEIDLAFAPVRSALAIERVVGEDLVLLDPESGSTHVLNAVGRVFWSGLDGRTTLEELGEDLADAVGAPVDDVAEPILDWARALGFNRLLEGVAPSEADLLGTGAVVGKGEPLPVIVGERLGGGEAVRLPAVGGRPSVLLHWSFGCGYCIGMIDDLQDALPLLDERGWDVSLLVPGDRADVDEAARAHGLSDLVVVTGTADDEGPFHDLGTPAAYAVNADGLISEPLAYGAWEVPAMLRRLAGLAPRPTEDPALEPDTDQEADESGGGPFYLALPPSAGVCAPSASKPARTWTEIDTFLVGDLVVGIRAASPAAQQLVRRMLAPSAFDGDYRQPNYSVVLPGLDDEGSRELNLLLQGDTVVVRSRSPRRVVDALLGYLSADAAPEDPDLWPIAAFPVVRAGRAVLLPPDLRSSLAQVQPRLSKAGLAMVDLPFAMVDSRTAELVIPRSTIPQVAEVTDGLGPTRVRGTELAPASPGRYLLAGWVFPDPGPDAGIPATSLAVAVSAIARQRDERLLAEVDSFLDRVPVLVGSSLNAMIAAASEHLAVT